MTEQELSDFLKSIRYGTLSFLNDEGWPDMRPLNFAFVSDRFYFHANGFTGEKLKYLDHQNKVVISLYKESDSVGKIHLNQHQSVLIYGHVERIDQSPDCRKESIKAMKAICVSGGTAYKAQAKNFEECIKTTGIFRVQPVHIAGKIVCFTSTPEESETDGKHN